MIYNNLLFFLAAIFLFSIDTVPATPLVSPWLSVLLFVFLAVAYDRFSYRLFRDPETLSSAGYFRAETRLSILALVAFVATLHLCDAKYYLSFLTLGDRLPALMNVAGLALFMLYLSLMWRVARRNYQQVFGRRYTAYGFILSNIKANLPIVIPWVMLSLCYDLLALLPFPGLQLLLASEWGDLLFFGLFLVFVVLFFPPLVRRLWGCEKLQEGPLKRSLVEFCAKQNFAAELYTWPLFEGRVVTAGVMGIVPGLRYILLTPAIIETMSMEELEAVMAHEIGHVKKRHLLLYILLIGGFSAFAGFMAEPFIYLMLSREFFTQLISESSVSPESILTVLGAAPLLVFMLVYFRYIFGYFIRNFERQADLHVISAVGNGRTLVSAFEKIAVISGDIRDQPNWHHFGIGERIECLEKAEREPELVAQHDKKVRFSLLGYVMVLAVSIFLVQLVPTERLARHYEEQVAEAVLLQKARQEPDKALWQRLIGDLMLNKKMEAKALVAYEKALSLEPDNAEIMNNLAWLLLTSRNLSLRSPLEALTLARTAAALQPKGYILDTLATAYWANGFTEQAVQAEKQAAFVDSGMRRYYQAQAVRFHEQTYEESVAAEKMKAITIQEE